MSEPQNKLGMDRRIKTNRWGRGIPRMCCKNEDIQAKKNEHPKFKKKMGLLQKKEKKNTK